MMAHTKDREAFTFEEDGFPIAQITIGPGNLSVSTCCDTGQITAADLTVLRKWLEEKGY